MNFQKGEEKKSGKEEIRIIKEQTLYRGERKLVLGDKNLKKIKEQLVSIKKKLIGKEEQKRICVQESAKTLPLHRSTVLLEAPF